MLFTKIGQRRLETAGIMLQETRSTEVHTDRTSAKNFFGVIGSATSGSQFWPHCFAASITICCHFSRFFRDFVITQLHNRPIGEKRNYFRNTKFRRLLDNQFHIFPLRNRLGKSDGAAKRFRFHGHQVFQLRSSFFDSRYLGSDLRSRDRQRSPPASRRRAGARRCNDAPPHPPTPEA